MSDHDRPDDLASAIYVAPRPDRPRPGRRTPIGYSGAVPPPAAAKAILFDDRGGCTESEEDAVAMRAETGRGVSYHVKFSTGGPDIGHMYNPVGLYFRPAEAKRYQAKTGRARYEFRRVPERAFGDYLQFLRSRTESFLRNAERQVLDA